MTSSMKQAKKMKQLRELVLRKRLSQLWGVEPFRLDVESRSDTDLDIQVDGAAPSEEQMRVFAEDFKNVVRLAQKEVN